MTDKINGDYMGLKGGVNTLINDRANKELIVVNTDKLG